MVTRQQAEKIFLIFLALATPTLIIAFIVWLFVR